MAKVEKVLIVGKQENMTGETRIYADDRFLGSRVERPTDAQIREALYNYSGEGDYAVVRRRDGSYSLVFDLRHLTIVEPRGEYPDSVVNDR